MPPEDDHATLLASVATAAAAAAPALAAAAPTATPPCAPAAPPAPVAAAQPEGLTAAAALELVATGYPAFAGKLNPLIALARNGTTEAAFTRAIVSDLAAPTQTGATAPIDNRRDNAAPAPNSQGGPKAEAVDRGAVFAGRSEAMSPAR